MSTSSNPTKSTTAAATAKGKVSSRKDRDMKAAPPPLKVVIRRLPHEMKEGEFLNALTWVAAEARLGKRVESWDLVYFAPGKMSKKRGRVTSTAYLQINRTRGLSADLSLIKLRAAVLACEAMTGLAAKDAKDDKASEKSADAGLMVLAAPFQKLFKQKPKRDVRVGTIEKDADFKAFCASLQSPPPSLPKADVQADTRESESKEEPKPQNALLDFLKERGAKKSKDGQRTAAVGSASRGTRRGTSTSGGSSGSTSATTTSSAAAVAAAPTPATRSKAPPPQPSSSSSSIAEASPGATSKPSAKSKDAGKEPPNAQKSRSGGGSGRAGNGSSKSRAPRGNSNVPRAAPPPAAQEHTSESGSEASVPLKEKGGVGSGTGGGGRRGGGGGKARAGGKSTGSGGRPKGSGGDGSGSGT